METVIIIVMSNSWRLGLAATVLLAAPFALASCSSGGESQPVASSSTNAPSCPTAPVEVVVSVDQWGGIVSELGGACAKVTTLLASSSVDPHDYEPSPADAVKFSGAQLVVVNGGHYDEWAAKLAAGSAPAAPVVDAVQVSGLDQNGTNPHTWYSPTAVTQVADAVTAQLSKLAPGASDYFAQRRGEFTSTLRPYDDLITAIKTGATGKRYAASEGVFDYMASALGLQNETPAGYQTATNNESDPSPADLDAFLGLLRNKGVDVLIYNTQTEGSVPQQLRSAAESAGVPVVEVTETVAPGAKSFEAWQVDQLTALAKALGVAT
jgi:zinc/manganese transport system substrate-binding protein